jgi:DNA-binding response OmpR family regulator
MQTMSTDPAAPVLLYVEDEFLIQDMLVTALEEAGFHVLVANDGSEALEILGSPTQALHGLITDINLGAGPDGWDISRTAREITSGLPVVYVSAASEHEWTSRGVPSSVMISKPFVPAQVVVAISSLLIVSE